MLEAIESQEVAGLCMHICLKAASGVRCVHWTLARFEYWEHPMVSSTRRSRALHSVSLLSN